MGASPDEQWLHNLLAYSDTNLNENLLYRSKIIPKLLNAFSVYGAPTMHKTWPTVIIVFGRVCMPKSSSSFRLLRVQPECQSYSPNIFSSSVAAGGLVRNWQRPMKTRRRRKDQRLQVNGPLQKVEKSMVPTTPSFRIILRDVQY